MTNFRRRFEILRHSMWGTLKFPFIYFFWRTISILIFVASVELYAYFQQPYLRWRVLSIFIFASTFYYFVYVRLAYKITDRQLAAREFAAHIIEITENLPTTDSPEHKEGSTTDNL